MRNLFSSLLFFYIFKSYIILMKVISITQKKSCKYEVNIMNIYAICFFCGMIPLIYQKWYIYFYLFRNLFSKIPEDVRRNRRKKIWVNHSTQFLTLLRVAWFWKTVLRSSSVWWSTIDAMKYSYKLILQPMSNWRNAGSQHSMAQMLRIRGIYETAI